MATKYTEINNRLKEFIQCQKMFFVGTATCEGRVSVSPKGLDSLRVLGNNRVVWLNLTGSGNETATHLGEHDRITIMFCAFEGEPMILRLYGHAKVFNPDDSEWDELISLFPPITGARQIIDVNVDLVQTSCGGGVPCFDFVEEREYLKKTLTKKVQDKIKKMIKGIIPG